MVAAGCSMGVLDALAGFVERVASRPELCGIGAAREEGGNTVTPRKLEWFFLLSPSLAALIFYLVLVGSN